jgi:hypothetical protein
VIFGTSLSGQHLGKRHVRVRQSELERFIGSGEERAQPEDRAADSEPVAPFRVSQRMEISTLGPDLGRSLVAQSTSALSHLR